MQSSEQSAFLRIGTRGSPLALAQAHEVQARLAHAHGVEPASIAIVVIQTTGDAIQDRTLAQAGGKGLFTKEIEEALLEGRIDLAVHSSKDMPTVTPDGLVLAAFLPREDVRDAFISPKASSLAGLTAGSVVGTASLRRQAQVLRLRPDLKVVPLRGNVQTRLRKLNEGVIDATLLALAGLKRLGMAEAATALLDTDTFLPAIGQGAICIETRDNDTRTRELVSALDDFDTTTALHAERAFLAVLDGSCRTPIAGHARLVDGKFRFRGMILRTDGSESFEASRAGDPIDAVRLASDAGEELKKQAGPGFFDPV